MKTNSQGGNFFAIFLLVIPIFVLVWVFTSKDVKLPLNQLAFVGFSCLIAVATYIPLWLLAFGRVLRQKEPWLVLMFTAFLWLVATVLGAARINQVMDSSPVESHYRKIVRKHQSSSSSKGSSSRSCTIWFDKTLYGAEYGPVKSVECDHIDIAADGVQYEMRLGRLGYPWIQNYSIVKDFRNYIERLNISYDQN